jgi:hypothetical protein
VQHRLRHKIQPQPDRVIGELPGCPQQVLRPLTPLRPGPRDHIPGERGRLRRHRRRPPPPYIDGNISIRHTALILTGMPKIRDVGCDHDSVSPTPDQQARAQAIAAEITARLAGLAFALPGTVADRLTRCGYPGCRCHADPPQLHGPYHQWTRKKNGKTATRILTDDQLADYAPWFHNHKRLRELITELEALSLDIADNDPRWNR